MSDDKEKLPYEPPTLTRAGDVADVTQGTIGTGTDPLGSR